jgi:hypothetical protein
MLSGDTNLLERFEAQRWPESAYTDEDGIFLYRSVPNSLDITVFLSQA